jgi:hypothetical protein
VKCKFAPGDRVVVITRGNAIVVRETKTADVYAVRIEGSERETIVDGHHMRKAA